MSDSMWRARLWIPYASMPVGLGLLTLQYVVDLICLLTGREPPFGLKAKETAEDVARAQAQQALGRRAMSPTAQGSIVLIVTLVVLLSGAPVAFGLGAIAVVVPGDLSGSRFAQGGGGDLLHRPARLHAGSRFPCS